MSIVAKNLQEKNISTKVIKCVESKDKIKNKQIILKVALNGHNTGYSVKVSNEFFYDEPLKKEVIHHLEKELNREVDFGTRHIYIGNKLC